MSNGNRLRDLGFGLLGIVAVVGGITAADLAVHESPPVFPESAVAFPVPRADVADEDSPGAVVVPIEVGLPEPAGDDVAFLPGLLEEGGEPGSDPAPAARADSAEDSDAEPAEDAAPTASDALVTFPPSDINPLGWYARFVDGCALDSAPGCPFGVAGTVTYTTDPPPLEINFYPDATVGLYPELRCDLDWPSSTAIPLVVLSNRPLDQLSVYLRRVPDPRTTSPEGLILDTAAERSAASEVTRYDELANKATRADVASGVHHCILLETDGVKGPPDRTGAFSLKIVAVARTERGREVVERDATFFGQYQGTRLPVQLRAYDQYRALVSVPQHRNDSTSVWVLEKDEFNPSACAATPTTLNRRAVNVQGYEIDAATLNSPDWAWDRADTHISNWYLNLKHSTVYTLCVLWTRDWGDVDIEEYTILTPDGLDLAVVGGAFRHTMDVAESELHIVTTGVLNCPFATSLPIQDLQGNDTFFGTPTNPLFAAPKGSWFCTSGGNWVGPGVVLRGSYAFDYYYEGDTWRPRQGPPVLGFLVVPTDVLAEKCGPPSGGPAKGPPCHTALQWVKASLCGGDEISASSGKFSHCEKDVLFSLEVDFYVTKGTANNRPDPKDWAFFKTFSQEVQTVPAP